MKKQKNNMDLFVIDADNLIGNIRCFDIDERKFEILKGTKDFTQNLYSKLEEYRNIRNLDDVGIMVTTSKGLQHFIFYQLLLNKLNNNLNIKFAYGVCNVDEYNPNKVEYVLQKPFCENDYVRYETSRVDIPEYWPPAIIAYERIKSYNMSIAEYLNLLYEKNGLNNIIYITSDNRCRDLHLIDKSWFERDNVYEIDLKDVNSFKDTIPYNRDLVLKQMNKLNKYFKDGNEDFKTIERDYSSSSALFGGYDSRFDFYEGDELVASVNPSKVKKKQL